MNIVLTGSNGFIGRRLLEKLSKYKKYKILNLVRSIKYTTYNSQIKYLRCNLDRLDNHIQKIIEFNPNVLIHLAWDKIPNFSYKNSKKNKNTSIKLIKLIEKKTKVQNIIISGSCFELYPPNKSYKYFKKAKNEILKFVKKRSKLKNFNFQWLRIFYVYGPKQRKNSLIPFLIKSIRTNKKFILNSPNNKHDFIYIDDVCDCIIKCLKKNIGSNIFEVGNGKTSEIKKIIQIIERIKNKKFKLILNKNKSNKNFKAKIENLKKKLNWKPKISINKGLKMTLN
tara:strand:- start:60 stop:905 length:846 start_codon:yes stop_codon:yes gene_type:complete